MKTIKAKKEDMVKVKEQILVDIRDYLSHQQSFGKTKGFLKYINLVLSDFDRKKQVDIKIDEFWNHWYKAEIGLDSGYTVPEMYYFAVRDTKEKYPDEEGAILYLVLKAEVWGNDGKFPDKVTVARRCYGEPDIEFDHAENGLWYYDNRSVSEIRDAYLNAGFEENTGMINELIGK